MRGMLMALLAASLLAGIATLFVAFQLHRFQDEAAPEPQSITLAQLAEKGAGDNAHVRVTDFVIGRPILEKSGSESWAWAPMYPANTDFQKRTHPPVVWRVAADESTLSEVLSRPSVTAIVSNEMPNGSPWSFRLPIRFANDYPTKEPSKTAAKTIRLVETEARVWGWSFGADLVLAPWSQRIAWGLGVILSLLGLGGLVRMARAGQRPQVAAGAVEASELMTEAALSTHAFNSLDFTRRSFKISLFCGVLLVFAALLNVVGLSLLARSPNVAFTITSVTSGLMLINALLFRSHFQFRTHGVFSIDVCVSGIRWIKAKGDSPRVATWSQIADLELNHSSPYPWRHFVTITLMSGERLKLAAFSLTNYHAFARLVNQQDSAAQAALEVAEGGQKLSTAALLHGMPRQ